MELLEASAQAWRLLLARFPAAGSSGESGVFSCGLCAFKTPGQMGAPDWGKFQPVGSFEMEVTSSGLKKNCQAGPPGPGWPLGLLCWTPGPSAPGPHPAGVVYSPNNGLSMERWLSWPDTWLEPLPRPRYLHSGPGQPGGAQEVCPLPSVSGLQCRVSGKPDSLDLLFLDSEEPCPGSSPTEVPCRP